MDGMVLGLFLFGAFIGGLASGLAGFAMGVVVSGIWLHIITPIQTTTLIIGYGLLTQGYAVWKLTCVELEASNNFHNHGRDWRPDWDFLSDLSRSVVHSHRSGCLPGAVQYL